MNTDLIGVLNGTTSNEEFNQFCDITNMVFDQIAPKKMVKISTKQRYVKPWMTKGLEKSSSVKMRLYRATLTASHTDADITKYKYHQNLYNKLKCTAKEDYYTTKSQHKGSIIPYIMVDRIKKT